MDPMGAHTGNTSLIGVKTPNFPTGFSKRLRSLNSTKAGHSNFQTLEDGIPAVCYR